MITTLKKWYHDDTTDKWLLTAKSNRLCMVILYLVYWCLIIGIGMTCSDLPLGYLSTSMDMNVFDGSIWLCVLFICRHWIRESEGWIYDTATLLSCVDTSPLKNWKRPRTTVNVFQRWSLEPEIGLLLLLHAAFLFLGDLRYRFTMFNQCFYPSKCRSNPMTFRYLTKK